MPELNNSVLYDSLHSSKMKRIKTRFPIKKKVFPAEYRSTEISIYAVLQVLQVLHRCFPLPHNGI